MKKYFFFDVETTGLPKDYKAKYTDFDNWPRLVQLAFIVTDNIGNILSQHSVIIKPNGFEVPKDMIHGISNEQAVNEGKDLKAVLSRLKSIIEDCDVFICHNVGFDKAILSSEFLRNEFENPLDGKPSLCTMLKSVKYCAIRTKYGFKWPKLQELHVKLFDKEFKGAHDALADIVATKDSYFKLVELNILSKDIENDIE